MSQLTIAQAFQLALHHHQAGQLPDAESIYRRILALQPEHAEALHLLGVIAHQVGRQAEAVELIGRAISLRGDDAEFHNNLGEALRAQKQTAEAAAAYRSAIRLRPDFAPAHNNLGVALRELRQFEEAEAALRQAIRLQPAYATAHYNLANVFDATGRLPEAISAYGECLRLAPDFDDASLNLSSAELASAQPEAAIATLRAVLQRSPDHANALNNFGNAFKDMGALDDAIACFKRAADLAPHNHVPHSNLVYALHFHPAHDAQTIHAEHQRWNVRHANPLAAEIRPHANDRNPGRRLRVGYVSPDFYHQAECFFVVPLLEAHDHQQFEVHCYASVARPDTVTARLRASADTWHDVAALSDAELAEKIRADGIDILMDLTMHMGRNRLPLFARRPAPVQVTWLAYPGSTGLKSIDYRFTDAHLEPPGEDDLFSSESPVRLPDSWCCYDPVLPSPACNELPATRTGQITFGSLNNLCKVNDVVLRRWARVLNAVSGSRLLLLAPECSQRERIRAVLGTAGVTSSRIDFATPGPRSDYLAHYHRIDIGLDPFPYNGITTTCDALWMGVPVLTLPGKTAAGRAGASLLTVVGLPEMVARNADDYLRKATDLARDLDALARLRAGLRARLQASPLMDAPRFARNVEAAYREMWQRWCSNSGCHTSP